MRRVLLVVGLAACGQVANPSQGVQPPAETAACAPQDTNPYGVCYPTNVGTNIGSAIPNLCFDLATRTCLAQLYDPELRYGHMLLALSAGAMWLGVFNEEADLITGSNTSGFNPTHTSWEKEFGGQVLFGQVIVEGLVPGTGTTSSELANWISAHDAQGVYVFVPGDASLGVFFTPAALPFNMLIDLRSMAILTEDVGFDPKMDATLSRWLAWIATHPPGTPP